jgi:hypothetical protein
MNVLSNRILKDFENSNVYIVKETKGDRIIHWYKALDIEDRLNLTNIRQVIQHFSEKEKSFKTVQTTKGMQKSIFLSSQGVYRLLFACKNEQAVKFRDWIGDILDDIIFNESKEIQNQLPAQTTATPISPILDTFPPIPRVIDNMQQFYIQWASEMRDKYNVHAQEHKGQIKWSKLFPKNESNVMKKRYNRLKHFLNYLDKSTNSEFVLQQLEQFAIDNKITHNRLVKDVFYQCMRSETVNAADDIKDAVKNLQTLLDKLNANV